MTAYDKASTGHGGLDQAIDNLRLGDNVVWQVDDLAAYRHMVKAYVDKAREEGRTLIYCRFGSHEPVVEDTGGITVHELDASRGFENFAVEVHRIAKEAGRKVFYVFDCLTDLLDYWHSDLMIGNFFKVTCPYLYELDTVAYFAVMRNAHNFNTIAGIRETTQLLLDLYQLGGKLYVHPLKVWQRYSPTMFFPHLIQGEEAISLTASSEVAELFSSIQRAGDRMDHWDAAFKEAEAALGKDDGTQAAVKDQLVGMLIGSQSRMAELCSRYFTLADILAIASREVGSGFIGGKSVGMLLARKILEKDGSGHFPAVLEPHDSFYLGSDIFYTYIVQNGWWKLWTEQKSQEGYYAHAQALKEKFHGGSFPKEIREQFIRMLEYFGQSPIIVRSSSLLEDNFGNAFAGKYESVFCANQGTPEERYEAFEQAVRTVYASTMSADALAYRMDRGLSAMDEQMAVLVQRVSGNQYGDRFFPHIAGVGNSSNLYVWDSSIDMEAGMLRMVFGLGTRAVDRAVGDYARIVCLDDPLRQSPMDYEDKKKYTQHGADIISIKDNVLESVALDDLFAGDIKTDKEIFASLDHATMARLREMGYRTSHASYSLDFGKLLKETAFPEVMREILSVISTAYDYPVDIEFTGNFAPDGSFKINLLQCRPLQTRGLGKPVELPELQDDKDCFFFSKGHFMGGNVRLPIDHVVLVDAGAYKAMSEQEKYTVARLVGQINTRMKGKNTLLVGPGRWGTTTPSLGVPVHFTELSGMTAICELSSVEAGFMPELSYGSHFFQDIVETGIFYAAIFEGRQDVLYNPEKVLGRQNLLAELLPQAKPYEHAIHIARVEDMEIFSDILNQRVLCR